MSLLATVHPDENRDPASSVMSGYARLLSLIWIPAFAGMNGTVGGAGPARNVVRHFAANRTNKPISQGSIVGDAAYGEPHGMNYNTLMTDDIISSTRHFGDAPYLIFCDHASNVIPAEMHSLDMPGDLLQTHIAWDIGSGALGEALARRLNGVLFSCGFSRLIVDPNRAPEASDLIPECSDQIPVPGNQNLSDAERNARIAEFHEPYHARLAQLIDELVPSNPNMTIISVHSFTERLMGAHEDRPWEIGLLWRRDEQSAKKMISYLQASTKWTVGDNEPYDARVFNYSIDRHIAPRGLRHITLELRQDLIGDQVGVDRVAETLTPAITAVATDEPKSACA